MTGTTVRDWRYRGSRYTRYLHDGVGSRERTHRARLAAGIAGITVLGAAPVFVHHSAVGDAVLLRSVSELGNSYLTAIHHVLGPVHTLFHIFLFGGFFYAVADRLRALVRVRRALQVMPAAVALPGSTFWVAAQEAGLSPDALRIVDAPMPNPAFTVGWLHPRVYIRRDLALALSPCELTALLTHEAAHVARRDPLRLSALRFAARWLFWVPVLGQLVDDVSDEIEVAADDHAAARDPLMLASAILRVAQWPTVDVRSLGAVGFVDRDILDRRVLRLAGDFSPIGSRVTRRSAAAAAAALLLVWLSGAIVAHPLPAPANQSRHALVTVLNSRRPEIARIGKFIEDVADGASAHTHE